MAARRLALTSAALTAAVVGGCGGSRDGRSGDFSAAAAHTCPGASAGARVLRGSAAPRAIVDRVSAAEDVATRAATALQDLSAPAGRVDGQAEAVRSLLTQATRLRLVREQIARGSPAPAVLDAARPGLTEGDRQTRANLRAIGVAAC
jgi:hypothetical protein